MTYDLWPTTYDLLPTTYDLRLTTYDLMTNDSRLTTRGNYIVKYGVLRTNLTTFVFTKHDHLGLFKEASMWGTMASVQGEVLKSNLGSSDLAKQLLFSHHASKRDRLGPSKEWLWARRPKPSRVNSNFDYTSSYDKTPKHVITFFIIFNLKMAKPNLTYGVLWDLGQCGNRVRLSRLGQVS